MMKVLVTGGTGAVGKEVVRRLVAHKFQIKVLCRTPQVEIPGATYLSGDITDYPSLRSAVEGFEAVVHLAAIPNPSAGSSEKVFLSNAQGTFNVFKACEEEGIRRVVQASSINALGIFYGKVEAPIHYLPVDEDHPCVSTDAYSFAKHVVEDIGDYYWRRSGISSVALRLPYVTPVAHHQINEGRKIRTRELCDRLLQRSPQERLEWFEQARQKYNRLRAQGVFENRAALEQVRSQHPEWIDDGWYIISSRSNFFTCLDERDSAQAIEKGLTASYEGSHPLFVNDDHNSTGLPSSLLAELFYPDVKTFKKELLGSETLISMGRARTLLGFNVEYSFGIEGDPA